MIREMGICHFCGGRIEEPLGYVFYSGCAPPQANGPVGLVHLCETCTDEWFTNEQYQRFSNILPWSLDFKKRWKRGEEDHASLARELDGCGIVRQCMMLGMWPPAAKARARAVCEQLWKQGAQGTELAVKSWMSSKP